MVYTVHSILWLEGVDLGSEMYVVTEEINGLASGVDLGLVDVLALTEHAGSIEDRTVLGRKEFSHLESDGSPYGPVSL